MTKQTYIVRHNGIEIAHRKTARTYTHAVIVRSSYEQALVDAQAITKSMRSEYDYACRQAAMTIEQHMNVGSWVTAENAKARIEVAQRSLDGALSFGDYANAVVNKRVAHVEKLKAEGYYDRFGVVGYCGRLGLAQSLASKNKGCSWWAEVVIVETETFIPSPKPKKARAA